MLSYKYRHAGISTGSFRITQVAHRSPVLCCFLSSQTAVGLFNSAVKSHLLVFANRGSKEFTELKEKLGALAQEFVGKVRIWVLVELCKVKKDR